MTGWRAFLDSEHEFTYTEYGVPHWAHFQYHVGITRLLHTWQSLPYVDTDCDPRKTRYTQGALIETLSYQDIEPLALDAIDAEALVWQAARGRTWLTPVEHRAVSLEKRYMRECDSFNFKKDNRGFEPSYRDDGRLVEKIMHAWIGKLMNLSPRNVQQVLASAETVYTLRAQLDLDDAPPVRLSAPKPEYDQKTA